MNKNQDKIDKIYNYKLYKLPIEIIYKIIHKFNNIQDLINFYDVFDKYRKNIILSIGYKNNYNFNPIQKIIKQDDFYENIDNDYIIKSYDEKEHYYLNRVIRPKYKNHIIYKKIIQTTLKCYKCKYIFNLNYIKHIYICIYCGKYICSFCCIDCSHCKIYNRDYNLSNGHCINCTDYYCLYYISMDLKKNKDKDNKKMENIKKRLIESYIANTDEDYSKINDHNFIDNLNITDDLKDILKRFSNEL